MMWHKLIATCAAGAMLVAGGRWAAAGPPSRSPAVHRSGADYRLPGHTRRGHRFSPYPDYAWGPPWGSFSWYVGPGVGYWPSFYYSGYPTFAVGTTGVYLNLGVGPTDVYPSVSGTVALGRLPAIERFLAGERTPAPGLDAAPAAMGVDGELPPPARLDEATLARAGRRIGFGDAHFARHDYRLAGDQYRAALALAPELADGHYRLGYALIGEGQYGVAAECFQAALALDPSVTERFRVDALYGDDGGVLQRQLDKVAERALINPRDGRLLLLIGLMIRDRGEFERAGPFLQKAAELLGPDAAYLERLLPPAVEEVPIEPVGTGVDT